jgi:hypothetical protein
MLDKTPKPALPREHKKFLEKLGVTSGSPEEFLRGAREPLSFIETCQKFLEYLAQLLSSRDGIFRIAFISMFDEDPDSLADFVMCMAERGDWEPLAVYLEAGLPRTREMQDFLVSVLRQKKRRPNNRSQSVATLMAELDRARFVLKRTQSGQKRARAIDEAVSEFNVNRRTIERNVKVWEGVRERTLSLTAKEREEFASLIPRLPGWLIKSDVQGEDQQVHLARFARNDEEAYAIQRLASFMARRVRRPAGSDKS